MIWNKEFQRIHKIGSNRFGWNWVNANEEAVKAIYDELGVVEFSEKEKAMVSAAVLAVLEVNKVRQGAEFKDHKKL